MKDKKRILLIGELYRPLIPWFLEDKEPKGVPAVYNLYKYLSTSSDYCFHSIVYNREINIVKTYPNGSVLELKKLSFPHYYIWKLMVFFKLIFVGNRLLKSESFDLVYGLSTFSTIAAILGKWRKIPSVGRIYGTILTKDVMRKNYLKLYTRFIFDVLAIKIPADKLICTQDGTQFDVVSRFFNKNKKVNLLFNGMDESLREKLLSYPVVTKLPVDETINLCYIARLETYKRQELAIDIVDHLVHKLHIKNVKLTVFGAGSREQFLKNKVDIKGLKSFVFFKNEVAHELIPEFIKTQHLALFFYEGGSMGNILWECGLAGRLIVTVNNGATGEFFKDGINCLIAEDDEQLPEIMAQKIAALIGMDISSLTMASRLSVSEWIKTWEKRFDLEFRFIFDDEKLPEPYPQKFVNV